ncbi:uncharacterized protein KY384_009160 [Bacidia gigantensis]|uniref:uncharacterized protein n=1 Tax=Bacidia gigantensis TaxID=2732470 RepID=UPI001D0563F6|nr:uncharacterized protein KY384_009160 [Bacidia gigantensis]KAG8525516.1 hypothetical protein KY384_009160 [Bacidia gigantensis]
MHDSSFRYSFAHSTSFTRLTTNDGGPKPTVLHIEDVKKYVKKEMTIGNFNRLEEIGKGSFATVYKAAVSKQPGFVAIKSVDINRLNKKLKENLYSEIKILKGMHHPHIVALVDCKESTAHIHLIMEFCELGDLSYFIKKKDSLKLHETMAETFKKYPNPPGGGLNEVIVRHFVKQLANAIEFLRTQNCIHRDVKPQNLLLNHSPYYYSEVQPAVFPFKAHEKTLVPNVGIETLPTLKLADFGFARSLPTTSLAETLCGSPLYMAPEILRYEKYDASVDLWSTGTVLYEMLVGKPPFKAVNHVELLRRIEKSDDRIAFPREIYVSDSLKSLVRQLLKRNPAGRMSFQEFFKNTVITDEIPGLTDDDRARQLPRPVLKPKSSRDSEKSTNSRGSVTSKPSVSQITPQSSKTQLSSSPQTAALKVNPSLNRRSSGTPPRAVQGDFRDRRQSIETPREATRETSSPARRPSIISHATAPARHDLHAQGTKNAAVAAMERKSSRTSLSSQEKAQQREKALQLREAKERAAQDVAFERDYVVVEKRAVEVNAFADELDASPRIQGNGQDPTRGAMIRRATQQGPPASTTGAQVTPSRALQVVSGKRQDSTHHRRSSYERRLREPISATSAISKAITMASGRLFGLGYSPPFGAGPGGHSPPSYAPFPAYPTNQGSLLMIDDGSKKTPVPLDEDSKTVQVIEDNATRSDVVFGFAEVKYKQLIPLAPSTDQGLGLRMSEQSQEASTNEDEGLTIDAIVTLSEEALVLYVKALAVLAKSMDIASAWWMKKNRGEILDDAAHRKTANGRMGNRINNVVQWVRSRFNETLEKAEFVRLKLVESQKQLPPEHPSHPNNHPSPTSSASSADQICVTSGITAEKLMYDRALEMSRSAAVNELVGEDLPNCELAYATAIRMLEAVLEDDDELATKKAITGDEQKRKASEDDFINGVEAEDRQVVVKRKL